MLCGVECTVQAPKGSGTDRKLQVRILFFTYGSNLMVFILSVEEEDETAGNCYPQ